MLVSFAMSIHPNVSGCVVFSNVDDVIKDVLFAFSIPCQFVHINVSSSSSCVSDLMRSINGFETFVHCFDNHELATNFSIVNCVYDILELHLHEANPNLFKGIF
jgi:hypothetical protein